MMQRDKIPSDIVTFAVGDIHGCLSKLVRLLDRCHRHAQDRPQRFVFLGDYVDRGPDSRGVIETLRAAQRTGRHEVICLRGNHEALMLAAVRDGDFDPWLANGAEHTLASYGVNDPRRLPVEHVDWVASLPFSFDDGRRFFVHAGVNPDIPLNHQRQDDQIWIREPFLSCAQNYGRLIVHGHTPLWSGIPDLKPNRLNLDTAAVMGGPLTAAVFAADRTGPVAFLTDREERQLP